MTTSLVTSPVKYQQQQTSPLTKSPQSAPLASKSSNFGPTSSPFQALKSRIPAPPLSPVGRKRGRRSSTDTCPSPTSDNEAAGATQLPLTQSTTSDGDVQKPCLTPNSRFGKVKERLKYFDRSMSSLSEKTTRIPFAGIVKAKPLPFTQLDESEHSVISLHTKMSSQTSSTGGFQQTMDSECKVVQRFPSSGTLGGESDTVEGDAPTSTLIQESVSEPTSPTSKPKLRIAIRLKDQTPRAERAMIQKRLVRELSTTSVNSHARSSRSITRVIQKVESTVVGGNEGWQEGTRAITGNGSILNEPTAGKHRLLSVSPQSDALRGIRSELAKMSGEGKTLSASAVRGSYQSNTSVLTDAAVTSETRRTSRIDKFSLNTSHSESTNSDCSSNVMPNASLNDERANLSVMSSNLTPRGSITPRGRVPRPKSPARAPLQLTLSGGVVNLEPYNVVSNSTHVRSQTPVMDRVPESPGSKPGRKYRTKISSLQQPNLDQTTNVRPNPHLSNGLLQEANAAQPNAEAEQQRLSTISPHTSCHAGAYGEQHTKRSNAERISGNSLHPAKSSPTRTPKTPRRRLVQHAANATLQSNADSARTSLKSPYSSKGIGAASTDDVKLSQRSPWGVRLRSTDQKSDTSTRKSISDSIPAPPIDCSLESKASTDSSGKARTTALSRQLNNRDDRGSKEIAKSDLKAPFTPDSASRKQLVARSSPVPASPSETSAPCLTGDSKRNAMNTPRMKYGRKSRPTKGEATPSKDVKSFASSFVFGSKILDNHRQNLSSMSLIATIPSPPLSPTKQMPSHSRRSRESSVVRGEKLELDEHGDRTQRYHPTNPSAMLSPLESRGCLENHEMSVKDRLRLFQALDSVNKELLKAREQVSAKRRLTFSERQKLRLKSVKQIQAVARGMIQRQRNRRALAAQTIQAVVRARILSSVERSLAAVIRIQAFARGIPPRLKYQLRSLQNKLEITKQRKRNDLMLIQLRKWKEMEEMRKELDAKRTGEASVGELEDMQAEIERLKRQNSSYIDNNHKLTEMQLQLKMMRMMTEQSLSIHTKNYGTMEDAINVLSEKNAGLQQKINKYEERVNKRQLDQDELKLRIQYEKAVRALTEKAILSIVEVVENRSDDKRLVARVLAISNDEEIEDDRSMGECSTAGKSYRTTGGGFELSFRVTGLEDDEISMLDVESTVGAFNNTHEHRIRCDSKSMFYDLDETDEDDMIEEFEVVEEEVIEDDEEATGDGSLDECSCESSLYEERSIIM